MDIFTMKRIVLSEQTYKKIIKFMLEGENYTQAIERIYSLAAEAQFTNLFLSTHSIDVKCLEW